MRITIVAFLILCFGFFFEYIIGFSVLQGPLIQLLTGFSQAIDWFISAIIENPLVAQAAFVGAQAVTSVVLVYLTLRSVRNGQDMRESNQEMVKSNQNVVKETRKDRKRESVKKLLTNIEPLKKELETHGYRIEDRYRRRPALSPVYGETYPQIPEWDLDLSFFPKYDLRRIEDEIGESSMIPMLDKYEREYKNYRIVRSSAIESVKWEISNDQLISEVEDIEWSEVDSDLRARSRSGGDPGSHCSSAGRDSLTEDEVKEYIESNQNHIAEALIGGESVNPRYKIVYKKVLNEYREDDKAIQKLDSAASELKSTYEELGNEISNFNKSVLTGYDILPIEIDEIREQLDRKEEEEEDGKLELETVEVSDVASEVGSGTVYVKSKEYDKSREDIKEEDYETYEDYNRALHQDTPGTDYDSISILKGGWVHCIRENETGQGRISRVSTTYPPEEIEKITRFESQKRSTEDDRLDD